MEDYSVLIESINNLAESIKNNGDTYGKTIFSTVLATIGSIVAVLVVDFIKSYYIKPNEEFEKLRRKINSTLSMYACYYTNQIDLAHSTEKEIEIYSNSSKAIREIAVELQSFADEKKRKKHKDVNINDISESASLLMILSNRFFTPYNCPHSAENRENYKIANDIRNLLNIKK